MMKKIVRHSNLINTMIQRRSPMKRNIALFFIVVASLFVAVQPAFAQEQQQLPTLVLISNVNIFDGKTEKLHKNMHVLVKDNLIETMSNEPLAVIQTDNVTMIDGGGRTLMPGMIEGHGHVMFASHFPKLMNQDEFEQGVHAARRANDYLMNGFTTIRDCGGNSFGVKRALDADIFPGPRIYPGGAASGRPLGMVIFGQMSMVTPISMGRIMAGT